MFKFGQNIETPARTPTAPMSGCGAKRVRGLVGYGVSASECSPLATLVVSRGNHACNANNVPHTAHKGCRLSCVITDDERDRQPRHTARRTVFQSSQEHRPRYPYGLLRVGFVAQHDLDFFATFWRRLRLLICLGAGRRGWDTALSPSLRSRQCGRHGISR